MRHSVFDFSLRSKWRLCSKRRRGVSVGGCAAHAHSITTILWVSHSDWRKESLTKPLSVLKSPNRLKEETSNQATFGLSGHCPYGDLSGNRLGKTGKSQPHLEDKAQCLRFLPSVEMTVVLKKRRGVSEGGYAAHSHSITTILWVSHSDRREESLTKPFSVLKSPGRLKEETSNQATFGFEKSRPTEGRNL